MASAGRCGLPGLAVRQPGGLRRVSDAYSKEKEVAPVIGVAGALRGATAAPRKYLLRLGLTSVHFSHVSPLGIYRHLGPPITIRMPNQHSNDHWNHSNDSRYSVSRSLGSRYLGIVCGHRFHSSHSVLLRPAEIDSRCRWLSKCSQHYSLLDERLEFVPLDWDSKGHYETGSPITTTT